MPLTSPKPKKYTGPFLQLNSIGAMVDGKIIIDTSYNKVYLTPDEKLPLSAFMIPLIEKLLNYVSWDSVEVGHSDIEKLKKFLDDLEPETLDEDETTEVSE